MPIYEYRCTSCGHELEALQKFADAPLTACPACKSEALVKLVSAAGFHLKGSGWYATDFKNGSASKSNDKPADSKSGSGDSKPAAEPAGKTTAPAAAAAPACGSGGCAACT